MARPLGKQNIELVHVLVELRRAARAHRAPIWRSVAERLERGRHRTPPLNVGQLDRLANEGDTVVVPGKLLAEGPLSKKLTVAAFAYSEGAVEKVLAAGGTALSLPTLLKSHPDGTGVRLLA